MPVNSEEYQKIVTELKHKKVTLVAVSKTKPVEDILELYKLGQRDFGENYVQELVEKHEQLPKDIRWHFIGHLQSNKAKQIAPFIALVHSVDSNKLLKEINKQAKKNERVIDCLLQVYIAKEETKFGLGENELKQLIDSDLKEYKHVSVKGLMGMGSLTDDETVVTKEFHSLKSLFDKYSALQTTNFKLQILSMGMSSDYNIAVGEGSNMVRIGSLLFGKRETTK